MRKFLSRLVSTVAILGVLLAAMPVQEAHAAGIVVNADTEPIGLLSVVPDGKCTLREAVASANADNSVTGDCTDGSGTDTITFAATYTITLSMGELIITSPITIQDTTVNMTKLQAGTCIICDPPSSPPTWRVLRVEAGGNLTLENIMVRFGRCVGACLVVGAGGGGILVNGGSLWLNGSQVQNNEATSGGGIYNEGGTVKMTGPADSIAGNCETSVFGNEADEYGGGIYSDGGTLNFDGACIRDNKAYQSVGNKWGGGIYTYFANATFSHVLVDDNRAEYGAGMFNEGGSLTLQNARFYQNVAYLTGGAIYNLGTSPAIDRVSFYNNGTLTNHHGGAIYNDSSSPSITNSVFRNNSTPNTGGSGGGIYNTNSSTPSLTNVTFSGNTAAYGGAIYNNQSAPTLMNVTLSGNTAAFGGGIYNFSSNPALTNVILWGDTGTSAGAEFYNLFSTPVIDHSVVAGACPGTCTNIIAADPMLGALASNGGPTQTMALGAGSSALDAGTNSGCPAADQRGFARPQGETCDIGAYEVDYFDVSGNVGIAGASLSYVNNGARSATADGSGNYSIGVPEHWSGTVTPSKNDCTFTPTDRSYRDITANQIAQSYSAACILPPVTISGNTGVVDAVLSYEDGGPQTTTSLPGGVYVFTVPSGWSGTVTPSKDGCTFTPVERSYSDVTASLSGQDYVANCAVPTFLISGNAGVGGATISYENSGPQSVMADPDGAYGFTVPPDWSGTVTPAKDDFLFSPASRSYNNVVADQLNQDYAAEKQTPSIARFFPEADSTSCRKPGVGVDLILAALVRTPAGGFSPATVTLKLDNAAVTSQAHIRVGLTSPASRATILFQPPSDLALGPHQAQFIYPSPSGPQTATWDFSAANTACGTTLTMSQAEPTSSNETQPQAPAERVLTSAHATDSSPVTEAPTSSVAVTQDAVAEAAASPFVPTMEIRPLADAVTIQSVVPGPRGSPAREPHRRVAPWHY